MIRILPNILTMIRLIMAITFVPVFFYEQQNNPSGIVSLVLYTLASITDIVDGYIARKYSVISDFGKIFDPMADKLLQFLVSICISCVEPMFIIISIFLFIKEILMLIGAIVLYKQNIVVCSNLYGKLASVIYFLLFFTMLGFRQLLPASIKISFIVIFLTASVIAFLKYIQVYISAKKTVKQ